MLSFTFFWQHYVYNETIKQQRISRFLNNFYFQCVGSAAGSSGASKGGGYMRRRYTKRTVSILYNEISSYLIDCMEKLPVWVFMHISGFCVRCGHNVLLPPDYTAAQKVAALELHNLDWCPRSRAAVIEERRVKRRRLDLVRREEDANQLFIPGKKSIRLEEVKVRGSKSKK